MRHTVAATIGALLVACSGSGGEPESPFAITSVAPDRGSTEGGTQVVVSGRGFVAGASVAFGDTAAVDVIVESATRITCTSSAHPSGWANVTVQNPDSTKTTKESAFLFDAPPLARAEHDRSVTLGARVKLDAAFTVDPDSIDLAYSWTFEKPAGSGAVLAQPETATPWFVADRAGSYTATLSVNDGTSWASPASVHVWTSATASIVPDGGPETCEAGGGRVHCPSVGEAGFGQDGNYLLNPPDLAVGAETVEDRVTSLTWQRVSPGSFNWFEASGTPDLQYNPESIDVCGNLVLGGYADWRLPTIRELATLLRYRNPAGAAIDLDAFPLGSGVYSGVYWSASQDYPDLWVPPYMIDFGGGVLTRGYGHRPDPLGVRCVRGLQWGVNALTDPGDGTVFDAGTGLEWQKSPPSAFRSWANALAYCEGLSLGGHDDWRLPSISEAMTIVYPRGCMGAFPDTSSAHYWSSTSAGASAFTLDCELVGWTEQQLKTSYHLSRCVR